MFYHAPVYLLRIYREAFSGLSRELWLLGIAALVNRCGTMVLPFLSIYLTLERGFDVSEAGTLVAAYGAGGIAGGYLGGWLADHIGSVRAQQFSLTSGGMSLLVLGTIRQPLVLALTLFIVAMLVESFRPAVMTAFAERAPRELQAKAFAFLRLAANLGIGIGAALGGALALYGYRWLFIGDAITCFCAAALLLSVRQRVPTSRGDEDTSSARSPFRDGPFLVLMLIAVVLASVLFQIFSTLPLYFREVIGLEEDTIGLLLALNALLIVVFEMILIHAVSRRDRVNVFALGALLLCAGFALMPYHSATWYLALTVAVWTVGEMLSLPILNVLVAERAGAGMQGRYMGLYTMAFATAFIVAPVVGTYVYDELGPIALWHAMGIVGIGLVVGSVSLKPFLKS